MNKLLICTVGTSIANGCSSLKEVQSKKIDWNEDLGAFSKEISDKISKVNLYDTNSLRNLSAELNTLSRIDLTSGDKVVFLSTDHAAGRICSNANKNILEKLYGCSVEEKRIEDLQVHDAVKLRKNGLKNLVKEILDYLNNDNYRYSYDIILNPTGGYKSIVPFVTILGMIYGKYSIYLFEFSNELIKLPPLPLTFDLNIYNRVKGALKYIENEVAIMQEAYFSKIINFDEAEKDLFLSFTELYEDNLITLSPLAYVFLNIEENAQNCKISVNALEKLKNINGEKKVILERLITNSANPIWRHQKIHKWPNTDLIVIKAGNTSERLAGFMKDNVFHIALIYPNHDEYENNLGKYKVSDFNNEKFIEWEPQTVEKNVFEIDKLQVKYDLMKYKIENMEEECIKKEIQKEEEFENTIKNIIENKKLLEKEKDILTKENQRLKYYQEIIQKGTFIERLKLLFKKAI